VIVLVSGATKFERVGDVGHLIVPGSWNDPSTLDLSVPWAMDNGAFSGFDVGAYLRMLQRYQPYQSASCLFVTAPDVVSKVNGRAHGDAAATFDLWPFWSRLLRGLGWCPAYVAQDGLQPQLVPDLRGGRGVFFIGGSTEFKEGPVVRDLCAYANARGIHVHMGRVNGQKRYALAEAWGVGSIDGTGFSMYPDVNIPLVAQWQETIDQQLNLGL
jgi:hypothetical protein